MYILMYVLLINIVLIIYYLLKYSETIWLEDDSYFIKYCGYTINSKIINLINYIIKYLGLVNIVMNNEAKKRFIIQNNNNILSNGVCFIGDSEFTTWSNLENDMSCLKYKSFNGGFGGARSIDILNNLNNLCLQWNPKYVILHIGGNDYDYNRKITKNNNTDINKSIINNLIFSILYNLRLINSSLKNRNIKLFILLSPTRPVYSTNKILFFNKLYNEIIKNYNTIDIRNIKHKKKHYRIDNLHLNHIGHKYKSKFILKILNNLLE